ncbi:MAG: PMT family glycosyltransferase, 4-amino-4-deoxy-L-arabinose transferase [Bacteroidetes bacterium]|nr:PMT family glycosyltransferase, 4-amino-4-deoxy-L-arabinose transferase [Bacteroidota bacterium]
MLKNQGHWLLFAAVVIVGLFASLWLYSLDKFSLLYYGDSVSHIVAARKLVDWNDPGLHQMGTVWLPLPHLLLLTFVLFDSLFTSGFAGVIVNLTCLAFGAMLIYLLAKKPMEEKNAIPALLAGILFAFNPNILYLALTPMSELPFLLFFIGSAFFFHRWLTNIADRKAYYLCSFFIALATMCRYEGWVLPVFLSTVVVVLALQGRIDRVERKTVIIGLAISLSGVMLWMGYNALRYGDPCEFSNARYYSAAAQAVTRPIRETVFLKPLNVLSMYYETAVRIYGFVPVWASILGIAFLFLKQNRHHILLFAFLALPPCFTLISLFLGIAEISEWFNTRYLVLLSPLVSISVMLTFKELAKRAKRRATLVIGLAILLLFVFQWRTFSKEVVTYREAQYGFRWKQNPSAVKTGELLRSIYDEGTIAMMTGSAQEHRIMITSGIPLRQFDELIESSRWKKTYTAPWFSNRWLVMSKEPDTDAQSVLAYWNGREKELQEHYMTVYENEYFRVFRQVPRP